MPVIVTVGLSRKVSKDFQSQGYSLNIQSELPATAVEDADTMARATDHLFRLANDLLDAEVANATGKETAPVDPPAQPVRASPAKPAPAMPTPSVPQGQGANGGGNGNGQRPRRGITVAQANAILKMAQKLGQDARQMARDEFGSNLSELTIRQASALINTLKQQIESATTRV